MFGWSRKLVGMVCLLFKGEREDHAMKVVSLI